MADMMNLYVANDVLGDWADDEMAQRLWTNGMLVVAAPDLDSIRDIILGDPLGFADADIDGTFVLQGQVSGDARVIAHQRGDSSR